MVHIVAIPVLQVDGLSKRYGPRHAVSDISFEVKAGEIVGFLGPNGAGKSTTLRMITGFLAPTAGRVRVGGVDSQKDPLRARAQIGYMPEGVPLYSEMRVLEYLDYRAELKGVADRRAAVERALDKAGVADAKDRIIGQLSKGYRQRVGFADALVADPPLLILDEPSSGLDPNQMRAMREVIRSFAGDKAVLVSTHILPEVEATCERVLIINEGKLVGEGAPSELQGRGAELSEVHLVGRGEADVYRRVLGGLVGVESLDVRKRAHVEATIRMAGSDAVEEVFRAVAEEGLVLRELRTQAASLEDVFAKLTTEEPVVDAGEGADDVSDISERVEPTGSTHSTGNAEPESFEDELSSPANSSSQSTQGEDPQNDESERAEGGAS